MKKGENDWYILKHDKDLTNFAVFSSLCNVNIQPSEVNKNVYNVTFNKTVSPKKKLIRTTSTPMQFMFIHEEIKQHMVFDSSSSCHVSICYYLLSWKFIQDIHFFLFRSLTKSIIVIEFKYLKNLIVYYSYQVLHQFQVMLVHQKVVTVTLIQINRLLLIREYFNFL